MSNPVTIELQDSIAQVRIVNPPVNALSHSVRAGLLEAISSLATMAEITAIVISGDGVNFSAGADIKEFGRPIEEPQINGINRAIELCRKPVVAAIRGHALGGGLEVAMACHYRLADSGVKLGLPEVRLGVMPGAGGTQRLPRLIGVENALRAIVHSQIFSAAEALQLGLVDQVVEADLQAQAIAFARRKVSEDRLLPLVRDHNEKLNGVSATLFDDFAQQLPPPLQERVAAHNVIRSVRNAIELPFDEALQQERELVADCKASPQAAELQRAFFAKRAAKKF